MHREQFITEFSARLRGKSAKEISSFFSCTYAFLDRYASGYELDGPILLVLDNSLIQTFKHREAIAKRGMEALAYTAFCRFVSGWSDRPTELAISPMAVYEHLGKAGIKSTDDAAVVMTELAGLFVDAKLPMSSFGFWDLQSLVQKLSDIEEDERYLSEYVSGIDHANWKTKLRTGSSVKFPFWVAYSAIPDDLPLRYFNRWYVKFVLSSRIERHIVSQSDDYSTDVRFGVNRFDKKGVLKGLGDIDLLCHCDISRQFQQKPDRVQIGQTLDRDLDKVLLHRNFYLASAQVNTSDPDRDQRIKEMANLMCSNPFAEQDARARQIHNHIGDFSEALKGVCTSALKLVS
jgi:hypothetical protein